MPAETHPDDLLRRFGSEIAAATDAMFKGPPDASGLPEISISPLRRLHEKAERYLAVARTPASRLWLFVLSGFLQDVFYNLSGDVPYKEASEQRRHRFFAELPTSLRHFGDSLATGDAGGTVRASEELVSAYLETVTSINDLLERNDENVNA